MSVSGREDVAKAVAVALATTAALVSFSNIFSNGERVTVRVECSVGTALVSFVEVR